MKFKSNQKSNNKKNVSKEVAHMTRHSFNSRFSLTVFIFILISQIQIRPVQSKYIHTKNFKILFSMTSLRNVCPLMQYNLGYYFTI